MAIQARAFDFNVKARTYRRVLRFSQNDYLFMTVLVGLLFGGLALNYAGLHHPTEQLVKAIFGL